MTTKATTKTQHIDLDKLRAVESNQFSSNWGLTGSVKKLSNIIDDTQKLGIEWPAAVASAIDTAYNGLQQAKTALSNGRPPLTWADLEADDLAARIRTAAVDDSIQHLSLARINSEITKLVTVQTREVIRNAAPEVLTQVIAQAIEQSEHRELVAYSGNLPQKLQSKISVWQNVSRAHSGLVELTDPDNYAKTERNFEAHLLHEWTDEQWLALHTQHDTLTSYASNVDWFAWAVENGIPVAPVTNALELRARTTRANDIGTDYNRKHRITRGF